MLKTPISASAFVAAAVAALAAAAATPALALTVTRSAEIAAPPAKVWAAIGEFCGIGDWHPADRKMRTLDERRQDAPHLEPQGRRHDPRGAGRPQR